MPAPTREPEKKFYVVKPNDNLWRIAEREYGDPMYHSVIQAANPAIDPSSLRVGQTLVLPALRTVAAPSTNTP